jgi:hypothetical protein
MGAAAAEMMLAKLSNGAQPRPSQVFKGTLIPGDTVAPPPAASRTRTKHVTVSRNGRQ